MMVKRIARFGLGIAIAAVPLTGACASARASKHVDANAVRLTTKTEDVRSCRAVGPPIRTSASRLGDVAAPEPEERRIRVATARAGGDTALVSHNGEYATAFSYRCLGAGQLGR